MALGSRTLLTQNSELRPDHIWNYAIPAWYVVLPSGERFKTCPNAGACAQVCYARNGTYRFSNVLEAHTRNLTRYLDDPGQWLSDLHGELAQAKFRPTGVARRVTGDLDPYLRQWVDRGGSAIRIHDSGDFFSLEYLRDWIYTARLFSDVLFYAYTKEVSLLKSLDPDEIPANFRYLFSTGGLEDSLIDPDRDRHADVFPTEEAIALAGYQSQEASDLLAILLNTTRIGIPANNIPHFNKKLDGRRFSEIGRQDRAQGQE
jgi:hypothetical protein